MAQITLRDYLQETEDVIGSKRLDKALANCQSILADFPDSLEAQRLLGEVYLAQGRLEDAQHSFDWVLSNDPENVITYCSRALVSRKMSDYDTALDCYQQAYELSRGNSQIRQAFNELSEQVGQLGFMLSRAGLARLYMRGDLIAQAIQEWDVVLVATPDRLDARTGLLEAYWREGLYEQVSQLANQILRDVPGCVKALVLLAHVTAPQDMLQSQELIQRAEVLDPDLMMAHDLFADHLASQSRDPFLKLLKKPPVVVGEDVARKGVSVAVDSPIVQANNFAFASTATSTSSSDALATWGNNELALGKAGSDAAEQHTVPSFSAWNAESAVGGSAGLLQNSGSQRGDADATYVASWGSLGADVQSGSPSSEGEQPEPWQLLQTALNNMSPEVTLGPSQQGLSPLETLPRYGDDVFALPDQSQPVQESRDFVEEPMARELDERQPVESPILPQENNALAPPLWLNMLAQTDRRQPSGVMPVIKPQEPPRQVSQPQMPQVEQEPVYENQASWAPSSGPDAGEDDAGEEELFFGPNWLKSLGATSLEGDQVEEFSMVVPLTQAPPETAKPVEPLEEVRETWHAQPEAANNSWAGGPFQNPQEQPKRGTWLDALGSSPEFKLQEPVHQSWEDSLTAEMQPEQPAPEYKVEHDNWRAPQYEVNTPQNSESPLSPIQDSKAEEVQEQPKRGTWLDALGSSPAYNLQEPVYQSWEDSLTAGMQPEIEQGEKEQPVGESWDSRWSEAEKGQPSWLSQMSGPPAQSVEETWQPLPAETQPQSDEKSEQNLVTTLEELELKLRSRGFIPLEPNSLSTIAQTQSALPSSDDSLYAAAYDAQNYQLEPPLPSALAELGSFIQPAASNDKPMVTPAQPAVAPEQLAEPSWLASLRSVPAPAPMPTASSTSEIKAQSVSRQETGPTPTVGNTRPYQRQEINPVKNAPPELKVTSPVRSDATMSSTFEATDVVPIVKSQSDALQAAAVRMNPLLDNELETTMKRPAVRLQPMQKRPLSTTPTRETPSQNRGRATEQVTLNPGNSNANNRERLLRGYQSQLIGDYDSAMQEYRIIIRSAPELLDEVVSNLRALLKLAPKYSAGYRVLGDAYMRQGEYLQAMEAYNKALTMAKKAKN